MKLDTFSSARSKFFHHVTEFYSRRWPTDVSAEIPIFLSSPRISNDWAMMCHVNDPMLYRLWDNGSLNQSYNTLENFILTKLERYMTGPIHTVYNLSEEKVVKMLLY